MDYLGKTLLPKVYQFVVIKLLQADKLFSPDFLKSIKSLYKKGDDAKEELLARLNPKEKRESCIDCKKGCSYCCGLNVKVAVPELYIILEHLLETATPKEIEKIIDHLRQHKTLMENAGSREERIMIKCTFLKDGSCSIYDVRPFACRAWNSTNVDSCFDYLTDVDLDIPTSIYHYAPYDTMRKAITKALFVVGLDDTTEELNSGVLRLLEGEFGER
jgi:Fe-S-cluster containining protein